MFSKERKTICLPFQDAQVNICGEGNRVEISHVNIHSKFIPYNSTAKWILVRTILQKNFFFIDQKEKTFSEIIQLPF